MISRGSFRRRGLSQRAQLSDPAASSGTVQARSHVLTLPPEGRSRTDRSPSESVVRRQRGIAAVGRYHSLSAFGDKACASLRADTAQRRVIVYGTFLERIGRTELRRAPVNRTQSGAHCGDGQKLHRYWRTPVDSSPSRQPYRPHHGRPRAQAMATEPRARNRRPRRQGSGRNPPGGRHVPAARDVEQASASDRGVHAEPLRRVPPRA